MSLQARMPHPATQGQLLRIVTAPSTPQLNPTLLSQESPHHCIPHAFVGAGARSPFYFLLIITLPVTRGKGLYGAFWWPSALLQLVTPGSWWNFLSFNFLVCETAWSMSPSQKTRQLAQHLGRWVPEAA